MKKLVTFVAAALAAASLAAAAEAAKAPRSASWDAASWDGSKGTPQGTKAWRYRPAPWLEGFRLVR